MTSLAHTNLERQAGLTKYYYKLRSKKKEKKTTSVEHEWQELVKSSELSEVSSQGTTGRTDCLLRMYQVGVRGFGKLSHFKRGIFGICLGFLKKAQKFTNMLTGWTRKHEDFGRILADCAQKVSSYHLHGVVRDAFYKPRQVILVTN